jgi:hypothetical protein
MAEEIGALKVKISADTKGLKKGLEGVSDELKKADKQAKKTSGSFSSLSKNSKKAAVPIIAVGAALVSVGVSLTAFTVKSAKARKEVEILARQANTTVEGFESLAFAANAFGVEAEQIADISKDLFDRLGEFATAGTGTFQDFLDVTKKTKQEGKDLAASWQHLSSEEVIGNVVSELESVNATGAQTTFVLESLGSDLSKLAPAFANNGKQLSILTDRYAKLTQELALTEGEAEDLRLVSKSFDELAVSSGKAATKISSELSPAISDMLDSITENIPAATKVVTDFINSFGTDSKIISVGDQIAFLKTQMKELSEESSKLGRSTKIAENSIFGIFTNDKQLAEDKARVQEITDQLTIYKTQLESLWDKPRNAPLFTPTALLEDEVKKKVIPASFSLTAEQQSQLDIKKSFLDQETAMIIFAEAQRREVEKGSMSQSEALFEESHLRELLAVQAQQEELMVLFGTGNAQELELWQSLEDQKSAIAEIGANQRTDIAKKEASLLIQTQLSAGASLLGSLASVASKSFKTQKAFAIAQGTMGIAGAMIKALDSPLGFPANLGLVAAVAAQGASLIGAIKSSKPGGGGAPSVTGGGGGSSSVSSGGGGGQASNAPETRNISVNLVGEGLMSTDQVRALIGQINESVGDGVELMTNGAT